MSSLQPLYDVKERLEYAAVGQNLVTLGGSEGLDLTFRTLLDPAHELIIPTPSLVC